MLFNEKEQGFLDQNEWGYVSNDYHGGCVVDNERQIFNPYLRWIFLEKEGYYLIQNPKTNKFLSSHKRLHAYTQENIENYGIRDTVKWTVVLFKDDNKLNIILKSVDSNQYLTAQNYKKYSPGESNCRGYHMTSESNLNEENDDYLKWKVVELTDDQLKVIF